MGPIARLYAENAFTSMYDWETMHCLNNKYSTTHYPPHKGYS